MTEEEAEAVGVAHRLAEAGVPVFTARPALRPDGSWDPAGGTGGCGYWLPARWEETAADPSAADGWRPGMALAAVCGHGLDVIDVDPRNGGDLSALNGSLPACYGASATPSGGVHSFIRSLGVRKRTNLFPGVDIQAGDPGGKGRGFVFIAPTVRLSKVTGELAAYRWVRLPDLEALAEAAADQGGEALAELVRASQQGKAAQQVPAASAADAEAFMREVSPWSDVSAALAEGRNTGIHKLAAALRGQGGWTLETALAHMRETVWPLIDQSQGGHEFTAEEFEKTICGVWDRYEDGAEQRIAQAADTSPGTVPSGVALTDAYLANRVAAQCLAGRFLWAPGLGWLTWDGQRWAPADMSVTHNAVRGYFIWLHSSAAAAGADHTLLGALSRLLSKARITAVTDLCRGVPGVHREAADFDAHPDLLNTPAGVVDLRTGEIAPHDPAQLHTKITSGSYRPGFTHHDWDQALTALDSPERTWYQRRIGQAITGHPTPDGTMPILQGSGENGKSALTTDGLVLALGDYADMASPKLVVADKPNRSEHSTERADLRGQRLLIGEELSEGRSIDITALKRIQDVSVIKARYVHKDNISFSASHSLLVTTNYVPVINETDHGTWRRLALLRFRYTFRKRPEQVLRPTDRLGDPGLKRRIKQDDSQQHDAIVTWAVEGARAWYADPAGTLEPTAGIEADTLAWRTTADRVLGFWHARLEPDPDTCILADEMLDAFNAWLAEGGHSAWSRETFAPRFAQHHETTLHGVESRRTAALSGVSRWTGRDGWQAAKPLPNQATVWMRVRFRTADDQPESTALAEVAESPANVPATTTCETFVQDSATSATKINFHAPAPAPAPGNQDQPQESPDQDSVTESNHSALFDITLPQAGTGIPLPALVDRDGTAESVPLQDAVTLIACAIEETRALTVDVETTGYPIGHQDYALRTVQLGHAHRAAVLDPADPPQAHAIRDLLAAAPRLHAHSATADLTPLIHAGLCDETAWERMHDTALIAKLTNPSADPAAAGLKQLSAAVLGDQAVSPAADKARAELFKAGKWLTDVSETTPRERSGWAQADPASETMARYAASDVLDTAALAGILPAVPAGVLGRERAVQRICARVTSRGLRIDRDHVPAPDRPAHRSQGRGGRTRPRSRHRQPRQHPAGSRGPRQARRHPAAHSDRQAVRGRGCPHPASQPRRPGWRPGPRRPRLPGSRHCPRHVPASLRPARGRRRRARPPHRLHPRHRHRPHDLRTSQPPASAPRRRHPRLHHRRFRPAPHLRRLRRRGTPRSRRPVRRRQPHPHDHRGHRPALGNRPPGLGTRRHQGRPVHRQADRLRPHLRRRRTRPGEADRCQRGTRPGRRGHPRRPHSRPHRMVPAGPQPGQSRPRPVQRLQRADHPPACGSPVQVPQLLHPGHRPRAARRRAAALAGHALGQRDRPSRPRRDHRRRSRS